MMDTLRMKPNLALAALAALALAACDTRRDDPAPEPTPDESPTVAPTQSIFAPEAGIEAEPERLEPLETVIGFGENGAELSEAARAELATVLASPQMEAGGPIVLGGHSDSAGSDAANLRASRRRAEAVRDWLVEQGVDEARITVIAFGEQNPAEPNALPDGQPNEAGRAANRRVEIRIGTGASPAGEATPSENAAADTNEVD